jgi:hypothetical protein
MTINEAKSIALKKIRKVGEDVLVTHTGDSENPRLKSSTVVGAVNSNQEFVRRSWNSEKGLGLYIVYNSRKDRATIDIVLFILSY